MKAVCQTCMHRCSLLPGQIGMCGARKNEGGRIVCANYGWLTALALDPVEKKPLKLFYPGSMILSAGSFGCNLKCPFCQNHEISMMRPQLLKSTLQKKESRGMAYISAEELAERAYALRGDGNIGIAFTYNEPLIGWEYVLDAARAAKRRGMKNVLVTNGSASIEVLEQMLPFIDAMNIDLKGFSQPYYQKLGGDLDTVRAFIARAVRSCHVELTTLIVPGENDSLSDMEREAAWIASLSGLKTGAQPDGAAMQAADGRDIPLHITRFFPRYRLTDRAATDVRHIYRLAAVAGKFLNHVFIGNC